MGEVGFGFELFSQGRVAGELFAVLKRYCLHFAPAGTQRLEHSCGDGGGFFAVHQGDQDVTTLKLHHRHQLAAALVGRDWRCSALNSIVRSRAGL